MCGVYNNFRCIFKYQVNEKVRTEWSASAPDLESFPSGKEIDPLPHQQPQEKQGEPRLWETQLGALVKQAKGLWKNKHLQQLQKQSLVYPRFTRLQIFFPLLVFICENKQSVNNLL